MQRLPTINKASKSPYKTLEGRLDKQVIVLKDLPVCCDLTRVSGSKYRIIGFMFYRLRLKPQLIRPCQVLFHKTVWKITVSHYCEFSICFGCSAPRCDCRQLRRRLARYPAREHVQKSSKLHSTQQETAVIDKHSKISQTIPEMCTLFFEASKHGKVNIVFQHYEENIRY